MNTAVINIKIDPNVKLAAQKVVEDLGLSLSGVINAYLKQLVRSKEVSFSLNEVPNKYLIDALKESKEDIQAKRLYSFKNNEAALSFLDTLVNDAPATKKD